MAWTAPKTWIPGETVDAAGMNLHVRDNLDWLYANIPSGLVSPDYCVAERVASQSISNGTWTQISFDTQREDSNGLFAPTSTTITIQTTGTYLVWFRMAWAANTTGSRFHRIEPGSSNPGVVGRYSALPSSSDSASGVARGITHALYDLDAADTITFYVYQNSGGALGTRTTAGQVPAAYVLQVA